jgi:hypothetical protein
MKVANPETPNTSITHPKQHPLSGMTVKLNSSAHDPQREMIEPGMEFAVEDWYDRIGNGSWYAGVQTWATQWYCKRQMTTFIPLDNEVVYGKIGHLGHLVHVTELGEVIS